MTDSNRCTIYFNRDGGGIPLMPGAINALGNNSLAFDRNVSLGIKASFRFKFKYWQVRKPYLHVCRFK